MKKDYEKEDYNKRTTAGSRSGSGNAHTDPGGSGSATLLPGDTRKYSKEAYLRLST